MDEEVRERSGPRRLDAALVVGLWLLSLSIILGLVDGAGRQAVAAVLAFAHIAPLAWRRRAPEGVLLAMAATALVFVGTGVSVVSLGPAALVAVYAGEDAASALGTAGNLANTLGVSALPGVVMLILGILATAGEYRHRTITQTFLTTPVRRHVMAAKLAALALVGLPIALGLMGAAFLAAFPRLLTATGGIDLINSEVAQTVGGNLLAAVLLGMLGASLGALLRNQLAAVILVVGWSLVGEGILSIVAGQDAVRWFPGGATQSVIAGGDGELALLPAALALAAYAGVLAAASLVTLRRDIA